MKPTLALPDDPTGLFLAVFETQKPRTLFYLERVIYKITGKKGEKQLLLETAFVPPGHEDKPRAFTVIGEHIACVLPTVEAGKRLLSLVDVFARNVSKMEDAVWHTLFMHDARAEAQAALGASTRIAPRARSRTPVAASPAPQSPAPSYTARTRERLDLK